MRRETGKDPVMRLGTSIQSLLKQPTTPECRIFIVTLNLWTARSNNHTTTQADVETGWPSCIVYMNKRMLTNANDSHLYQPKPESVRWIFGSKFNGERGKNPFLRAFAEYLIPLTVNYNPTVESQSNGLHRKILWFGVFGLTYVKLGPHLLLIYHAETKILCDVSFCHLAKLEVMHLFQLAVKSVSTNS